MSAGGLVSFMLYQQSLSSAFSMMGDVFSALTAAVGAADKVRCWRCSALHRQR
jgi:ATP-binding cassette subfamily B (MDR/TAP) protein 9